MADSRANAASEAWKRYEQAHKIAEQHRQRMREEASLRIQKELLRIERRRERDRNAEKWRKEERTR